MRKVAFGPFLKKEKQQQKKKVLRKFLHVCDQCTLFSGDEWNQILSTDRYWSQLMFGNLYHLTKSQTGERTSGEFELCLIMRVLWFPSRSVHHWLRDLTSEIPRVQLSKLVASCRLRFLILLANFSLLLSVHEFTMCNSYNFYLYMYIVC